MPPPMSIQFGVLSPSEIALLSSVSITQRELYIPGEMLPMPDGPLDERMGISNKARSCATCQARIEQCPGHFGQVSLALPVFHVGYIKAIYNILRSICKTCARVLAPEATVARAQQLLRSVTDRAARQEIRAAVQKQAALATTCPRCQAVNGVVKRAGALKFVHLARAKSGGGDRVPPEGPGPAISDLNPLFVHALFSRIPPQEVPLFALDPRWSRPQDLILHRLLVLPCCARPSVRMEAAGTNEDDLTVKLQEIVWVSELIAADLARGTAIAAVADRWELLQLQVALYIHSEFPGVPKAVTGASGGASAGSAAAAKAVRGLCQRLKGKQGRFRGHLSGKRIDYTARTVISPDPHMAINEVGIPLPVATTLTYAQRVSAANIDWLRGLVRNGPRYPGAVAILYPATQARRLLKYGDRDAAAAALRCGDVVERHLIDRDVVLFNRQPSLHRVSIMAHRVVVRRHGKTFRFNECVCAPYNADFDGDEMNVHVPQTEEARAEAAMLLDVRANLTLPKTGELAIGATQDFLTGAWLLTSPATFLDRDRFRLYGGLDLHATAAAAVPAILKPVPLYTGKQLFTGVVLANLPISTTAALRNHSGGSIADLASQDTVMVIRRGRLLAGQLDKSVLGGGSQSLFKTLLHAFGGAATAEAIRKLARLTSRFLSEEGLSLGLVDVTPSAHLDGQKRVLIDIGIARCAGVPGSGPRREAQVEALLSDLRDQAGRLCMTQLTKHSPMNAALLMALCGSKGSKINLSQMIACVGQQTVNGARIPPDFRGRTLPHFVDDAPSARGFVFNSFHSGLTPTEFFFHTMGGREGLVDTAVKTAETGYMQRRLMKALEDLVVAYDGTVRSASNRLVQLVYGDDGVEPTYAETEDYPLDLSQLIDLARHDVDPRPRKAAPHGHQAAPPLKRRRHHCKPTPAAADAILDHLAASPWVRRHVPPTAIPALGPHLRAALEQTRPPLAPEEVTRVAERLVTKLVQILVEPGTAVGALCGQSLGEPCTQMTLKTFHFAGVASMNITLGVPRIREIINATKAISTPIVQVTLADPSSLRAAARARAAIEATTLGQVASALRQVVEPSKTYIEAIVRPETLQRLQIDATLQSLAERLQGAAALKHCSVTTAPPHRILITAPNTQTGVATIVHVAAHVASLVVAGLDGIKRCVIQKRAALRGAGPVVSQEKPPRPTAAVPRNLRRQPNPGATSSAGWAGAAEGMRKMVAKSEPTNDPAVTTEHAMRKAVQTDLTKDASVQTDPMNIQAPPRYTYSLVAEGSDLLSILGIPGVDPRETRCNHILQIAKTLGIEAARQAIIDETAYTMKLHGVSVNVRHLMLLADCMTAQGEVLGITRFGIAKMEHSALTLASFEKTTDALFDAGQHAEREGVRGVSESIIMGRGIPLGTNAFEVVARMPEETRTALKRTRDPPLFGAAFRLRWTTLTAAEPVVVASTQAIARESALGQALGSR